MFHWFLINVKVTHVFVLFSCLTSTKPLICTLVNEYPSSDGISLEEWIVSLAIPCFARH